MNEKRGVDEQIVRETLADYARREVPNTDVSFEVHRRMLRRTSRSANLGSRRWMPAVALACLSAMFLAALTALTALPALRAHLSNALIASMSPHPPATPMARAPAAATSRPVIGKQLWHIGRGAAWGLSIRWTASASRCKRPRVSISMTAPRSARPA